MKRTRTGAVLALAFLVLVGLELLTASLLYVSTQELRIAQSHSDALHARLGAASAVSRALAAWRTAAYADMRVGELRSLPAAAGTLPDGVRYAAALERLAGGLFLLRTRASLTRSSGEAASARAGFLVRGLDLALAQGAFAAALTVQGAASVLASGSVDALHAQAPPPPWPDSLCPASVPAEPGAEEEDGLARPAILAAAPARVSILPGAAVLGRPPLAAATGLERTTPLDLGPLRFEDLPAIADRIEDSTVHLQPTYSNGRCNEAAPGNWGAPLDPTGPCGAYFPLIFASGSLSVSGGAGQGVLAVQGDLTFSSDARFYGAVAVAGRLVLQRGAVVHGAARVASATQESSVGGRIDYSSCALRRALLRSPALNRPFRPASRAWVPSF